jgi:two-component system phosphate regulon sensor histidine kinase PhoR
VTARIGPASRVLIVVGIVLAGLVLLAKLSILAALGGFAVMVILGLLVGRPVPFIATPATDVVASVSAVPGTSPIDPVIAALPDAVILLDRDSRVVAFNPPARAIAPALARGTALALALRVPEIVAAVREAEATGEARRVEYSERVPTDRWFAVHVAPVAPEFKLLAFQDLTPLRRVEEMRADFVANASHELRTPLAALSGFIDTLLGPAREDAAARERFLLIMREQAQRMARLIGDLLSLSRVELNEHLPPDTPLDLVPIVRQVADGLQTLARDRDVAIDIALPDAPLIVAGDRDELTRAYENLIENALKYGASGKKIEIAFSRAAGVAGPEAVVRVRDFGPGIPAEHLPRLTERFYRIDVGHSRAEGGTGLGLALVKHILIRHRGRLLIESTLGQGATFTTRLPLTGPAPSL